MWSMSHQNVYLGHALRAQRIMSQRDVVHSEERAHVVLDADEGHVHGLPQMSAQQQQLQFEHDELESRFGDTGQGHRR